MSMSFRNALLSLLLSMPTVAAANTVVVSEPGTFQGTIVAGTARVAEGGKQYDCYLLHTDKGQRWRIGMLGGADTPADAVLQLVVGTDCTQGRVLQEDFSIFRSKADLNFVSGGGTYIIRAMAYFPVQRGTYSIRFQRDAGLATSGFTVAAETLGAHIAPGWSPTSVSTMPSDNPLALTPGTVFRDCESICPEVVVVPAGSFMMGSNSDEPGRLADEGPRHEVRFARAFAVGRYEITHQEYTACVADKACRAIDDAGLGGGRRPVIGAHWNDALNYAQWLAAKTGQHYQLLSEAEWEYVARAGTSTPWNTGSAIVLDDANYLDQFKQPVPVGGYPANAFGLHDMHGNAREWVLDCHDVGYFGVPTDGGAMNRDNCKQRVLRGGGFQSEPADLRSASRRAGPPDGANTRYGFRIGRAL